MLSVCVCVLFIMRYPRNSTMMMMPAMATITREMSAVCLAVSC